MAKKHQIWSSKKSTRSKATRSWRRQANQSLTASIATKTAAEIAKESERHTRKSRVRDSVPTKKQKTTKDGPLTYSLGDVLNAAGVQAHAPDTDD